MADQPLGKTPPHHIQAERAVLGCILLHEKAAYIAVEKLKPEDFYAPKNALVFECVTELIIESRPIDLISVTDKLNAKNKYNETEDLRDLGDMMQLVPTMENLPEYIDIIKDKSILRQLAAASNAIISDVYNSDQTVEIQLNRAGEMMYNIAVGETQNSLTHIESALMESYKIISEQAKNKRGLLGVAAGFPLFDKMLSGLQPTQLIIVAGRPGMGKTSFGLNVIQNVAIREKQSVAIFSLEMSKDQLATRLMCSEGRVDSQKTRTGNLSANDFERLADALEFLSTAPIYIDDTPGITMTEILAKCRRIKMEHGLGLVMIDYLQLMSSTKRTDNRQQEISEITRSVKLMAKELAVPVILLSQLSRASEKRNKEERMPVLSDLRESGSIEQDADVVIFLHRENYYDEQADQTEAKVKIAKQRNGPTGVVNMIWNSEYTRFEEKDMIHQEDAPF